MTKDHYDILLKNPFALYLLYKLFEHHSDNLPDFIDRGNEAKILAGLGLVIQRGIDKRKHIHKQPLVLSIAGEIFAEDYCSEIFEDFKNLAEIDRESLMSCCENHVDREYAWQNTRIIHEELTYLPKLGEDRRQNGTVMKIHKYHRIHEPGLVFELEIEFLCKKCGIATTFIQRMHISEEQYEPFYFHAACQQCHLNFHCNSYFQRFYMDDIP